MMPGPAFHRSGANRTTQKNGFTLLELLVAMAVLSLLLVLLLSMVSTASRLWKVNENRVDSYREARAAMNIMASDLAGIFPASETKFFYTQEDHLPATPVHDTDMNGSLFFLTTTPADAQDLKANNSDLCTVGYFLGYDKTSLTGHGDESYNLYRYFRSSDETFAAISKGDLLDAVEIDTAPTSIRTEVLAKNITGFTIEAYTIPAAGLDGATPPPVKFVKSLETPLPDMVEITVTAINNDVARRFKNNPGAWRDTGSVTRRQNDRTFKTRIYLSGAAQVKPTPTPVP